MKHLTISFLFRCVLLCLSGCRFTHMEPDEIDSYLDGIVENIGDSQVTDDDNLIRQRDLGDDAY